MILSGKCIIVAGGTSGIGLEAVNYFLLQGAKVVAIGKESSMEIPQTEDLCLITGDLRDENIIQSGVFPSQRPRCTN